MSRLRLPSSPFKREWRPLAHPAQSQRRVVGALSGLVFAGMLVGVSASTRAVATEIRSEAPRSPAAARVVLVSSTTTEAPGENPDTTVLVTSETVTSEVPPDQPVQTFAPGRAPTTTIRRSTTVAPGLPSTPVIPGPTPTNPLPTNPSPTTTKPTTPTTTPPTTAPVTTAPPPPPTTTEPPPPPTTEPSPPTTDPPEEGSGEP